jgi:hypothetical protein
LLTGRVRRGSKTKHKNSFILNRVRWSICGEEALKLVRMAFYRTPGSQRCAFVDAPTLTCEGRKSAQVRALLVDEPGHHSETASADT